MRQIAEHPPPRSLRGPNQALAQVIGADTVVPCADGRARRYVNLDYAASTPVMAAVWDAVERFVPWYSSVHRGSGVKSRVGSYGMFFVTAGFMTKPAATSAMV